MIETKNWIYLDLEKTGSTFLRKKLLAIYPESEFLITKKHQTQDKKSTKIKFITIRDPFNYYFSLWSYGLQRKGGVFHKFRRINNNLCKNLYKDQTNKTFKLFLDNVLISPKISSGKAMTWLPNDLDIYSQRILNMIVPKDQRFLFEKESSIDTIKKLVKNYFIPEIILKTENLNSDFHNFADAGDLNFLNLPKYWKDHFPLESRKDNISKLSNNKLLKTELRKEFSEIIKNKSFVADLLK